MNGGNGYDEYDEIDDWDAWVEEAFQDYQGNHDPPVPPPKASSTYLPATLPTTKKTRKINLKKSKKWQIPIDWNFNPDKKTEKMKEELRKLKEERILRRTEEAKKISWKTIHRNGEYEVLVQGTSLGRVRQTFSGKWKMFPSFRWKKNAYNRHVYVEQEFFDFHASGKGLVDLWIIS